MGAPPSPHVIGVECRLAAGPQSAGLVMPCKCWGGGWTTALPNTALLLPAAPEAEPPAPRAVSSQARVWVAQISAAVVAAIWCAGWGLVTDTSWA